MVSPVDDDNSSDPEAKHNSRVDSTGKLVQELTTLVAGSGMLQLQTMFVSR